MSAILELKKSNCKNCYKCIRECPVKSIKFSENQANIINDECIYCGLCFVSCPQNAKLVRNDIPNAKKLIATGKKVYLSLAPSYIASFPVSGLTDMAKACKALGFYDVTETAIGADIVKREYDRMLERKISPVLISSCCHSVNLLIQKYYPQSLPYLASVMSPMLAHAKYLKEKEDCYVVFVGPCVSKKHEQDTYGIVDVVLTFEELKDWLNNENIEINTSKSLDNTQHLSRSFPIVGGIVRSMNRVDNITYMVVDGMDNCVAALKEIEQGELTNCFIEMSACIGSCIGGPSISSPSRLKNYSRVKDYAGRGDDIKYSLNSSLIKSIPFLGTHSSKPGESAVNKILIKMGKTSPEKELNCGSCGYNTCKEKAIAICEGKADLTMCLPFLKEKAESFSDSIIQNSPNAIIVMDEKLNIHQLNTSACQLFKIKDSATVIGAQISRLLSPLEYLNAMESSTGIASVRQYIAEYDTYVEESIVYDKDYHIIISIMKDITGEERENSQRHKLHQDTAEIADKVIEKQMRVVQEIASLLGETTAETKIALTKLKDALAK